MFENKQNNIYFKLWAWLSTIGDLVVIWEWKENLIPDFTSEENWKQFKWTVVKFKDWVVFQTEIVNALSKNWKNIIIDRAVEACPMNWSSTELTQSPYKFDEGDYFYMNFTAWDIKDIIDIISSLDKNKLSKYDNTITKQWNTFNWTNQLVKTNENWKIPSNLLLTPDVKNLQTKVTISEDMNKLDVVAVKKTEDWKLDQLSWNRYDYNWLKDTNYWQTIDTTNIDHITQIEIKFLLGWTIDRNISIKIYDNSSKTVELWSATINVKGSSWQYITRTFWQTIDTTNKNSVYIYWEDSWWQTFYDRIRPVWNDSDVYAWWTRYKNWTPQTWDMYFKIKFYNDVLKYIKASSSTSTSLWFISENWNIWEKKSIITNWIVSWFTWLVPWYKYYLGNSWTISSNWIYIIWKAISSTDLIIINN